jgi:hypothetical protein
MWLRLSNIPVKPALLLASLCTIVWASAAPAATVALASDTRESHATETTVAEPANDLPAGAVPGTAPDALLLTTSGIDPGTSIVVPRFSESEIGFKLDGELTEPVWSQVPGYDEMRVLEPDTMEVPRHATATSTPKKRST